MKEKIMLELSRLEGEKSAAFADRVYTLFISLNTFSKTPIGVKVSSRQGTAKFYYKEKKK